MSAGFRDSENDYQSQLDSVHKDLKTLEQSLEESERKSGKVFNRHELVRRLLEQHSLMKGSLAHMELESNEGPDSVRHSCKQRLSTMKKETFALEKKIANMKGRAEAADRADLLTRANVNASSSSGKNKSDSTPSKADSQLAEVAKNTSTMHKGTGTLTKALQYVVQLNDHGEATLVEMRRQDDTINRVIGTTTETDVEVSHSQRILRDMKMVAMKNHILLSGIVILLIAMIVALLYFRFGRPLMEEIESSPSSSPSSTGTTTPLGPVAPPVVAPHRNSPSTSSSSNSGMSILDGFAEAPGNYVIQPMIPTN